MAKKKKGVSGTKEWSSSSVNCMTGCANDCLYCYAKANAIRYGRSDPEDWGFETPKHSAVKKNYGRRQGTIMFPTTHDLHRNNIRYCEEIVLKLLRAGNKLLIVSKPVPAVIERLCLGMLRWNQAARTRVLFRFTIGSMDNDVLKFWEPNAPTYEERLYSLMWCHKNGWETSVSMEPLLEPQTAWIITQVYAMLPYVTDAIWLGKMNNPRARVQMNYGGVLPEEIKGRMEHLIDAQRDERMLKLYDLLRQNKKVKWKESLKKVFGLKVPTEAGKDI